ncbi:unnamed protein product [Brachionus calyciflorus]|uniref:Fungal lipase-type domain-containing protein n=1 Tax=Brachionus calyciflorus TaxID=104777 RepID=A0A813R1J2_9BILA|nr:unnamed protein product [Brachionus calyciflorus]
MVLDYKSQDFKEILFNCCLMAKIAYESNPIEFMNDYIENNFIKHTLGDLTYSNAKIKKNSIHVLNELINIRYLVAKNEKLKRIIVAFRGTATLSDKFTDIFLCAKKTYDEAKVHCGFYNRAFKVPTDYFEKNLEAGYTILLTGHSLGAATAALLTVKLLIDLNFKEKFAEKIYFIGFGCPLFGDNLFKEVLKKNQLSRNLLFIKEKSDFFVDLFQFLVESLFESDSDCFVEEFLNDSFTFIENQLFEKFEQALDKFIKKMTKKSLKICVCQNGILLIINETCDLVEEYDEYEYVLNEDMIKNIWKNHSIESYYEDLKKKILFGFVTKDSTVIPRLGRLNDLDLKIEYAKLISIERNVDHVTVKIEIELQPKENIEYFIGGYLSFCSFNSKLFNLNFKNMIFKFYDQNAIFNSVN